MKAVVAAFNQEKALVGAFSVIRMELFEALLYKQRSNTATVRRVFPNQENRGMQIGGSFFLLLGLQSR